MPTQRQHIFHSTLTRQGWEVREGGEPISRHRNQRECESAAIEAARQDCLQGLLTKAILHEQDGTVRAALTFDEPAAEQAPPAAGSRTG
jgi:hypothetical protein